MSRTYMLTDVLIYLLRAAKTIANATRINMPEVLLACDRLLSATPKKFQL